MPDPQVNIRIPAPELAALREEAERQSRKMTDIVRDALKIYTTRNWQLLRAMRDERADLPHAKNIVIPPYDTPKGS